MYLFYGIILDLIVSQLAVEPNKGECYLPISLLDTSGYYFVLGLRVTMVAELVRCLLIFFFMLMILCWEEIKTAEGSTTECRARSSRYRDAEGVEFGVEGWGMRGYPSS